MSDVTPLNGLIQKVLLDVGGMVGMKDPTRGGLADALNEFSEKSHVGILIDEEKIPIREDVKSACEMLGLDPYEVGNEGKILIGVVAEKADELDCDLIIVGTHTRKGINHIIHSNIAERVIRHTRRNLLSFHIEK